MMVEDNSLYCRPLLHFWHRQHRFRCYCNHWLQSCHHHSPSSHTTIKMMAASLLLVILSSLSADWRTDALTRWRLIFEITTCPFYRTDDGYILHHRHVDWIDKRGQTRAVWRESNGEAPVMRRCMRITTGLVQQTLWSCCSFKRHAKVRCRSCWRFGWLVMENRHNRCSSRRWEREVGDACTLSAE